MRIGIGLCQLTFDAVKPEIPEPDESMWSAWPIDFLPREKTPKATKTDPTPLEDRFQHLNSALDKRSAAEKQKEGKLKIPQDVFSIRLGNVRDGVYQMGCVISQEVFVDCMNEKYDLGITSVTEFTAKIEKAETMDKEMMGMVWFGQDGMWSDNNQWAINWEGKMMRLFCVKFTGLKSNGLAPKRITQGNCFHGIIVKAKNAVITERLRNTTKKHHRIAIFARNEKTKKDAAGDETTKKDASVSTGASADANEATTTATTLSSTKTPGSPSKKKSCYPAVVKRVEATVEKHGFNGVLGYCDGHPILSCKTPTTIITNDHDSVATPMTVSVAPSTSGRKSTSSVSSASAASQARGPTLEEINAIIMGGKDVSDIKASWSNLFSAKNVAAAAPVNASVSSLSVFIFGCFLWLTFVISIPCFLITIGHCWRNQDGVRGTKETWEAKRWWWRQ